MDDAIDRRDPDQIADVTTFYNSCGSETRFRSLKSGAARCGPVTSCNRHLRAMGSPVRRPPFLCHEEFKCSGSFGPGGAGPRLPVGKVEDRPWLRCDVLRGCWRNWKARSWGTGAKAPGPARQRFPIANVAVTRGAPDRKRPSANPPNVDDGAPGDRHPGARTLARPVASEGVRQNIATWAAWLPGGLVKPRGKLPSAQPLRHSQVDRAGLASTSGFAASAETRPQSLPASSLRHLPSDC